MFNTNVYEQTRWGREYADSMLFSGGMSFSDGGTVVENKFLNAVVEQQGFLAAFTGIRSFVVVACPDPSRLSYRVYLSYDVFPY